MSLLEIRQMTHGFGEQCLYKDVDLYPGDHVGIVGQNGSGKSTFIGILTGEVIPDIGLVKWKNGLRIGYLDQYAAVEGKQSIIAYLHTAYADLYAMEKKVNAYYESYAQSGEEKELQKAADLQDALERADFYGIDAKVDKIVYGLGLNAIGVENILGKLSDGQRAKVILAKLLLEEPDVLLLDEPTNFLDKEHVAWLSEYLSTFPNAFMVVSHDAMFLEKICNRVFDVEAGTIRSYHGNYKDFLRQKEFLREDYIRRYAAQQENIRRTEDFIRKNIAGVNTKIAKGRRKQLARMERIASPPFVGSKPNFRFSYTPIGTQELLKVRDLQIGYYYTLLPKINFILTSG